MTSYLDKAPRSSASAVADRLTEAATMIRSIAHGYEARLDDLQRRRSQLESQRFEMLTALRACDKYLGAITSPGATNTADLEVVRDLVGQAITTAWRNGAN